MLSFLCLHKLVCDVTRDLVSAWTSRLKPDHRLLLLDLLCLPCCPTSATGSKRHCWNSFGRDHAASREALRTAACERRLLHERYGLFAELRALPVSALVQRSVNRAMNWVHLLSSLRTAYLVFRLWISSLLTNSMPSFSEIFVSIVVPFQLHDWIDCCFYRSSSGFLENSCVLFKHFFSQIAGAVPGQEFYLQSEQKHFKIVWTTKI